MCLCVYVSPCVSARARLRACGPIEKHALPSTHTHPTLAWAHASAGISSEACMARDLPCAISRPPSLKKISPLVRMGWSGRGGQLAGVWPWDLQMGAQRN